MLELRPCCECCGLNLPPDSNEAVICSFECTFCDACNRKTLKGVCPNCGGDLMPRPTREKKWLEKNPPSANRIVKEASCNQDLKPTDSYD